MGRYRTSSESAAGFLAAQATKRAKAETAAYHRKVKAQRHTRESDRRWGRFCLVWHRIGFEIASNPLAPRWMTPAEVSDLVARARLMPEDGLPCKILPKSSSYDDALYVQELQRDLRLPQHELAALVQRNEQWVSSMLRILEMATPALIDRWRNGTLTEEHVRSIGTIKDPELQEQVVRRVAELRDRGAISAARDLALEYAPTRRRR